MPLMQFKPSSCAGPELADLCSLPTPIADRSREQIFGRVERPTWGTVDGWRGVRLRDGHLALSGDGYVLAADPIPGLPAARLSRRDEMASYLARQPPSVTRVWPVM